VVVTPVALVARVGAALVTRGPGVSAGGFVLAARVLMTLIVAAVTGMLPVASLVVTAAAAEQAVNQAHRAILLCRRLQ
jgi:hypothetical protein